MTELQFLMSLNGRLKKLPQPDQEEHLRFCSEIIEDRVEDGLCEEDAVAQIGSVDEIAAQILANTPEKAPVRRKGTLLSDKIFFTDTETGSVRVPKTTSGGRCNITAVTGSINLSMQ